MVLDDPVVIISLCYKQIGVAAERQANELLAGEVWPLLRELSSGRVRTMDYVQDFENQPNYPVEFLLLFDQRTGHLVRSDGVLIMDEPQRGSVADFAGTRAIYAGTGWW